MVADCVTKGNVVADVGCDHAYISIYLVENKIAPSTVALDVNQGPLLRARQNVESNGMTDQIVTRLSDGLEKLKPGEADAIVIAGMGGPLMIRILSEGNACVKKAKELVLSPQSEISEVRKYLHSIQFEITDENMCIDEGKYYTVIHAVNKQRKTDDVNDSAGIHKKAEAILAADSEEQQVFDEFGKYLLETKHPILKQFLEKEYATAKLIEHNLLMNDTISSQSRYQELQGEKALLNKALHYFD